MATLKKIKRKIAQLKKQQKKSNFKNIQYRIDEYNEMIEFLKL